MAPADRTVDGHCQGVFLFDVQGSVAKSTFAGLPWLLYLRSKCKRPIHFWPFDGWDIPQGKSAIVEVYPSLWTRRFPKDGRDGDEQEPTLCRHGCNVPT